MLCTQSVSFEYELNDFDTQKNLESILENCSSFESFEKNLQKNRTIKPYRPANHIRFHRFVNKTVKGVIERCGLIL